MTNRDRLTNRDTDFRIHARMKEGDSPCGLSITATDFYLYDRDKCFSVYEHKRKKVRKEIILVG